MAMNRTRAVSGVAIIRVLLMDTTVSGFDLQPDDVQEGGATA